MARKTVLRRDIFENNYDSPYNSRVKTSIKNLVARDYNITAITDEIRHFQQLESFEFESNCAVENISHELWKLPALQRLTLSCSMSYFPDSLLDHAYKLSHLKLWIDEGFNLAGIEQFNNLGSLALCSNMEKFTIRSLENIGMLSNLTELSICIHNLIALPDEITQLGNLETLTVEATNLNELPANIHKMNSLREINICYTDIKPWPATLFELENLETLNFNSPELWQELEAAGKLELADTNVKKRFSYHYA